MTAQIHTVIDVLAHLKAEITDACAPFRALFLLLSM
jgi:hypothetical protein